MTDFRRCAKEELPWCCNFASLDIGAFDRETIMDEARVLKSVVDVGSIESSMNEKFPGNAFDDAVVALTDSILVLMFGGGIGSSNLLFCSPIFKSGGFELSASIAVYVGNGVGCELRIKIGHEVC